MITGTVVKATKETKVGITFTPTPGRKDGIIIKDLSQGGLFAFTDLMPGLDVVEVNGQDVTGKTIYDAVEILRAAEPGEVTVTAKPAITGTVTKASKESSVGIRVSPSTSNPDTVVITELVEGGLFASTDLKAGMEVIGVNGNSTFMMTSKEIVEQIKAAGPGEVSVTAKEPMPVPLVVDTKKEEPTPPTTPSTAPTTPDTTPTKAEAPTPEPVEQQESAPEPDSVSPKRIKSLIVGDLKEDKHDPEDSKPEAVMEEEEPITGTVEKASKDTKVGIRFVQSKDGDVVISSIRDGSLMAATSLKAGYKVLSINGTDVTGKTHEEAIEMIKESTGTVTIEALAPSTQLITGTVEKSAKDTKVGIRLVQNAGGDIVIASITEGSLMAATPLKTGYKVVTINDANVSGKTHGEAIAMIKDCAGTVTIVAETVGTTKKKAPKEETAATMIQSVARSKQAKKKVDELAKEQQQEEGGGTASAPAAEVTTKSVTGTVVKQEKDTKVGISFILAANGKDVVIKSIAEGGLFSFTELQAGYQVLTINGTDIAGKTHKEAIEMIRGIAGKVTITACEASTEVKSDDEAMNASAAKIQAIARGNLAKKEAKNRSDAQPQEASKLEPAPETKPEKMEEESKEEAEPETEEATTKTVTGSVEKPTKDTKVGIRFIQTQNGDIVIYNVDEGKPFATTELKAGYKVLSVNGTDVAGKTHKDAIDMIRDIVGTVTVTASAPTNLVSDTVYKETATTKLGITLITKDSKPYINRFLEGGLFTKTTLLTGMEVLTVNGTYVGNKTSGEVVQILKEAQPGNITIVAKK